MSACGGENETSRYTTRRMSLWKKLLWFAVTLLGLGSIAILAMSRGEQVSALWIIVAGLCAFAVSYRFYSKWLANKVLVLNNDRAAPALGKRGRKNFLPGEPMDGFRSSLRCYRGPWAARRTGPGGAVWFSSRHALDIDRRDTWWWCARHDCSFQLGPAQW